MKILDEELEHLYLKFCSGDKQAQLQLYVATKNRLFSFLKRLSISCSGRVDAEDCMQITWESLWKKCASYHDKGKFMHYLFTVANSRFIDEYRKMNGQKRRPDLEGDQEEKTNPFVSYTEAENQLGMGLIEIGNSDDPEAIFAQEEQNTFLKDMIKKLPPLQQQAIVLHLSDYSSTEIAQLTGEKHEAVRMQLRYAKQKLSHMFTSKNITN
jgi:RNA polymerase sigma factor (sigma-70 family)